LEKAARVLMPLVLLSLAASMAGAVGKVTVDPNATGVKAAPKAEGGFWEADGRLGHKVTYEARRKPVRTILSDLSKITGVDLKAGYSNVDWQVRDRKMSIFCEDLPLKDLMQSVARVMKFKWSRNAETEPWTYRLYMDRKTVLETEAASQREEEKYRQEMADKRKAFFEGLLGLDKLSEEELNKLKETDPVLYEQTLSAVGLSFAEWLRQTPEAADALLNGLAIDLTASNLSAASQEALTGVARNCLDKATGFDGGVSGNDLRKASSKLESEVGKFKIRVNWHLRDYSRDPTAGREVGMIDIRYGDSFFNQVYWSPDNPMVKQRAKMRITSQEQGQSYGDTVRQNLGACLAADREIEKMFVPGDPVVEHPDEPDLHRKFRLKVEGAADWRLRGMADYQSALAKASGFAVVSDCFRQEITGSVPEAGAELKDILEAISMGFRSNWWKNGQVIEFRYRDWFHRRSLAIPDAQIDPWRRFFLKNGYIDIGCMAQIAQLTLDQQRENTLGEDGQYEFYTVGGEAVLLKLYATLTPEQRAALFSQGGLSLGCLAPPQLESLKTIASPAIKESPSELDSDSILTLTKSEARYSHGKHMYTRVDYTFTLTPPDVGKPRKWRIGSPTYQEPDEQKKGKRGVD